MGLSASVRVVHQGAEQRLANVQSRVMGLMISIKEYHYVTGFGIIGLLEAQFLEVVHKVDTLCPVGQ